MFHQVMEELLAGRDLPGEIMAQSVSALMEGAWSPVQQAAFLVALRAKGESAGELAAAAGVMRQFSLPVTAPALAVDTCGTGGDGVGTLNVSTAAAILAAGLGVPVAKHGNRSVSSRCGSADVLEALGWPLSLSPAAVERLLQEEGFAFLFAPHFHPAMKAVAPVRRELGLRTLFNLLGPLANPAGVRRQVVGVFSPRAQAVMAEAFALLGAEHVWVVHGQDGLDELSPCAPTEVIEVRQGRVTARFSVVPEELGLPQVPREALLGGDAAFNARRIQAILAGEEDAAAPAVALAAAAALLVAGKTQDLRQALGESWEGLRTGVGWRRFCRTLARAQELAHG